MSLEEITALKNLILEINTQKIVSSSYFSNM